MRSRSLLSYVALAALAACSPLGVCTLIGCENGVVVEFSRALSGPVRIEAVVPGEAAPRVVDCVDGASCFVLFSDLFVERLTLRVTTGATTYSQDFTPRYETDYPNGRDCEPACRQASVTFQLPS